MTPDLLETLSAVRAALAGGPAFAPQPRLHDDPVPDGTALVLRTSGSTGTPREVALSAEALRASAVATHERLGGPGRWLLVLPPTHVAGVQVVTRTVVAGTELVAAPDGPFTADGFAAMAAPFLAAPGRAYVSLVPTQHHRLVEAADAGAPAGLRALAGFDAVLVGGAATPAPLLARARSAGVRVVTTYGMSETSGGCVYDRVPLPGVRVRVVDGVVELAGPVLATGYVGDDDATAAAFRTGPGGTRWFRTSDLGALDGSGMLTILGRADDVVVTGGVNVAPAAVESVLAELFAVRPGLLAPSGGSPGTSGEVCVLGVPDGEWGQVVVAVVSSGVGPLRIAPDALTAEARTAVAARLGRAAAPREVYLTDALPTRGPGKVDRRAVAESVAATR
ncbi:AMP-binding protein [Antribacter gilvus]|uniref:AMP-binding protein n=1 Tax=Antribacter gilvus TaxID=2304675 RepID=UPI000F7A16AF|nr:AMP-binding protein [Antribacter gilvus]